MVKTLIAAGITAAFLSPTLHAQDAADSRESADDAQSLDQIVVTARRRAENAKDIPEAVAVLDNERLTAIGASGGTIIALSTLAPSLNAESSFGRTFPRFYLRGLGNTDFDLNASQPVSLVYDDVVLENAVLKGFPIFDIERVEVLRGPQGTLFGRNAPAGVIKFESVKPSPLTEGFARVGFGSYGTKTFEGAYGGGVGENGGFRLSALYQTADDYADNFVNGRPAGGLGAYDEKAFRAQYLFENDTFSAHLAARARQSDGGGQIFRANVIVPGSNQLVPNFDYERGNYDAPATSFVDTVGFSARLSWQLGDYRLSSISAIETLEMFARGDVDGGFGASFAPPFGPGFIPFPAESGDGISDHRQLTQELRLESPSDGAFNWQLGALIFDEFLEIDNVSYDTLAGNRENGRAAQRQDNRAYALFGAFGYQLNDELRLAGGLRFTDDSKDFVARRLVSPIGAGALAARSVDVSDNNLSGDLSLSYSVSDSLNVFGRVATGFRAPSVQGRLLFGETISVADSETVRSIEAGLKGEFLDRRARFNLAVFDYRVNDIQLTAVGGQANFNTLVNADRADGRGIEFDIEALLADNFVTTFGVSYNDVEINDPLLGIQPCGSGCTVLDPRGTRPGTVSVDGNPLPQTPDWKSSLTARYGIDFGGGELYAYTDWTYRTEVNFFLYESVEFTGDPLLQGGLRLGYTWGDGRYDVALFGRNILDEIETVGGVDFNNLTGYVNPGRFVGVEAKVNF
jgi:iron complex outermembrane recepter protein